MLDKIGDNTPIIKDYFGGGPIVIIFGSSLLVYFNLIPEQTLGLITEFVKTMDIFTFIVVALICGAILGMDRELLVKAGALYIVPVLGGVIFAFALTAIVGHLIGYGAKKAIFMITLPIMGGGTAAGAIPMADIYSSASGKEAGYYLSQIMPAVGVGNALAIVVAGIMNRIGQIRPSLTGNGVLMKGFEPEETKRKPYDVIQLGMGMVIAGTFMAIGTILSKFIGIHRYALTIIVVALVKIFDLAPEEIIEPSRQWYDFISKNGIPAVLIGVGMVHTDMNIVLQAATVKYFILCLLTILGAALGASYFGKLVGFYPIESGVTAGLCMANMGGSGDLATLAAAKRMELMQFAQISSRLGGVLILVIANIIKL